jgi:AAA+ ATPase superfamily predicted ATPase
MKAKKLENPFLDRGYEGPEYFCDREEETQNMISALKNGRNQILISPRRMGKTGLIHHVFHTLREQDPGSVTLYMDIFPTKNRAEFIALFASTILGQLDSVPKKVASQIIKFFQRMRPVISLDEITSQPKVSVDMAVAQEETSISRIFDYLESSSRPCYIAIDEFQQVAEYPEKGLEAALRSRIQNLHNVHFIFSGSRQHLLGEMFHSPKRPFYHSAHTFQLGNIDKDKYYAFAAKHFAARRTELPEDVFSQIYDAYEGHTWYVQAILNRIYSYGEKPNEDSMIRAVEQIIAENVYNYENLLVAYPPVGAELMKAIAREGTVREINSGKFIARHRLKAASSINSALRKLVEKELVYKSLEGYRIYDRFMAIWLRRLPY